MPERKVVIPSLVKLFASAVVLAMRARLGAFAIAASGNGFRELLVRDCDETFAQCELLCAMVHRLGGELPVSLNDLRAHSSVPADASCTAPGNLPGLIEGHEQIMRDVGFLLAILPVQDVPGLDELLTEINETNAKWAMALKNQLPGASEAAN